MNEEQKESIDERSNHYQPISSIESFNSLFGEMDQDSFISHVNELIDADEISQNDFFSDSKSSSSSYSIFKSIIHRIFVCFIFLEFIISFLFLFCCLIALIFEVGISFYSVIMMNYVFFVSSIVSYTMAPIYQSLSGDWLNFAFSFTQVILASPLISFYIFYILKSVKSLASFISEIPKVIKHIFLILVLQFKDSISELIQDFAQPDYSLSLDCYDFEEANWLFLISLGGIILASALAYVTFCLDKAFIILGLICYLINTLQIIMLILPSYLYFFQTLINMKSKEVKYVIKYIQKLNKLIEYLEDESDSDSNSDKSQLSDSNSFDSLSNGSYSMRGYMINDKKQKNKKETENKKKPKKRKRLINDPFIDEYVDEYKAISNNLYKLINMFLQIIAANNYYSLYYYSKTIAFDKHKKCRKIALNYIFFFLNLSVILYDIYKLRQNYSGLFLASIIIRGIFIPLFSYYNIFSVLYYKSKDSSLNAVLHVSSILTALIAVAIICCFGFTDFYQSKYRISNLNYVPPFNNITIANSKMMNHPICNYEIFDVSPIDAFGYSLGGYDVKRNITVFDNQMKIFFGENYSSHISYTINELDEHFLFLKYYDSSIDTHIFAFRGYNSGPEIAFQMETIATHYIIPFFEDIVPFYELINEYWLEFYTDFLNSFGLKFFENDNLMVKYVNSIIEVYNNSNLDDTDRVFFAGINCGGVIAKIVGTLLQRKSISFISFPIDNDLFNTMFDFSSSYISLVTNVYNVDGFFSDQEPRYATNIGIEIPVFDKRKFCTSGICDINSKTDNVYRTFCAISEICGKGNRFHYYCENIIGKGDIETIREGLQENG